MVRFFFVRAAVFLAFGPVGRRPKMVHDVPQRFRRYDIENSGRVRGTAKIFAQAFGQGSKLAS